jgi:hypothetical protein
MGHWTDYPITKLGDIPGRIAPIRPCRILGWDGDKYATMILWGSRKAKKAKNRTKGQTPGRSKGETCHATKAQRHMCGRNRSYKHRDYIAVMEQLDKKTSTGKK